MANDKTLKVTNRATGQSWMKTPAEIAIMKGNKNLADRFIFEKEVDAPQMAAKIAPAKVKDTPPDYKIKP